MNLDIDLDDIIEVILLDPGYETPDKKLKKKTDSNNNQLKHK